MLVIRLFPSTEDCCVNALRSAGSAEAPSFSISSVAFLRTEKLRLSSSAIHWVSRLASGGAGGGTNNRSFKKGTALPGIATRAAMASYAWPASSLARADHKGSNSLGARRASSLSVLPCGFLSVRCGGQEAESGIRRARRKSGNQQPGSNKQWHPVFVM